MLTALLVILLILALLGAGNGYPLPGGIIGLVLLIVLLVILFD